jgi:hypothetical protein
MKMFRKALLLSLAVGASMVGCSSSGPSSAPGTPGVAGGSGTHGEQTGTITMNLQLGPSISISSITYVITNPTLPGFTTITSTVDVSNSQEIGFSLTLPAGGGYTLALAATDSAGDSCSGGPVTFSITAGLSTGVGLTLVCSRTVDGGVVGPDVSIGTVVVTADASLVTTVNESSCASVSSLVVDPNNANVGHTIGLTAAGIDPSGGSSDVTLTWAATGGAGSLTGTTGTTNTFACTAPGTETVTVTAAISGGGASCPDTGSLSVSVTCDGTADASAAVEASAPEASAPDTGTTVLEASAPETGAPDTGTTAALAPCTTAGQANCVSCEGNATGTGSNGGLCTPTEAAFVQRDITSGIATSAGPAPTTGCYSCLYQAGCIDDTAFGDTNHECGDTLSVGTSAECLSTLSCILGSNCASSAVNACFCGTAALAGACSAAAPNATPNGACDSQIAAGNGFAVDDGTDNIDNLTNSSFASGKADQIFQCALSNTCTMCTN